MIYAVNIPSVIMFIILDVHDTNCLRSVWTSVMLIFVILTFFQLFIAQAILNRIRKIQRDYIKEQQKKQSSYHKHIFKLF